MTRVEEEIASAKLVPARKEGMKPTAAGMTTREVRELADEACEEAPS